METDSLPNLLQINHHTSAEGPDPHPFPMLPEPGPSHSYFPQFRFHGGLFCWQATFWLAEPERCTWEPLNLFPWPSLTALPGAPAACNVWWLPRAEAAVSPAPSFPRAPTTLSGDTAEAPISVPMLLSGNLSHGGRHFSLATRRHFQQTRGTQVRQKGPTPRPGPQCSGSGLPRCSPPDSCSHPHLHAPTALRPLPCADPPGFPGDNHRRT